MTPAPNPSREHVLESFLLDLAEAGALARYLSRYPALSDDLIDLAHQARRVAPDEAPRLDPERARLVDAARAKVGRAWPLEASSTRDLFATLRPADYARLSDELRVPRQVIGAVRNRRAIPATIPRGFLRRMAVALEGSIDELLASMGASPQAATAFKAVDRPSAQQPVSFEQILIEARVPDARRAEIMADTD